MDAAVAGLIGAVVGGGATLVGSVLTSRHQIAEERRVWLRDRKETAYSKTIRSLLRARNRRSGFHAEGAPYIAQEDLGTFFDDLIEAQHGLSMLTTACGREQRAVLLEASKSLDAMVARVVEGTPGSGAANLFDLSSIYDTVLRAAREDVDR